MLYYVVMCVHVIMCVVLITVILLQSGRGGGLSEMLGGGAQQTQKIFGTQTSSFMTRATSYCAIAFLITTILLSLLTSRMTRSLMEGAPIEPMFDLPVTAETNIGNIKCFAKSKVLNAGFRYS